MEGPHKTVIWITAITYDVLPTGELSGNPQNTIKKIYQVSGINMLDCQQKADKLMEEIENVTKAQC